MTFLKLSVVVKRPDIVLVEQLSTANGSRYILFIGIFNDIEIIILLFLFLGFSTTLIGIGTQTLIQLEVSEQFRARVLTWWSTISFGSLSIGGILIGLFGEIIPLELVLIITPIVGYLSYIYFLRRFNGSFSLSSKNVNA